MPVILRIKGYRFWFYQADLDEPPRVHNIGKDGKGAKYWIAPVALARTGRFREHELNTIERILRKYQDELLRAWRKEMEKRESC